VKVTVELVLRNGIDPHRCEGACGTRETVHESTNGSVAPRKREWPQPPGDDAPVELQVEWMERCAVLFDEIAVNGGGYGLSQAAAVRAAEYMRRTAKELAEGCDPAGEVAG
jgi:hypothetical protein